MCDYSLHNVASRPARVGDKLVIRQFNEYSRGFAPVQGPALAVCLLPGTEIAFEQVAQYDHPFRRLLPWFGFGKLSGNLARFRQINLDRRQVHHDALEFGDGRVVLLTRLCAGQRVSVLQLPAMRQIKEIIAADYVILTPRDEHHGESHLH